MNTPRQPNTREMDDEISLVDLAKILIRRWKLMALVFIAVVTAALVYTLTIPRTYEYVSIYQVAEQPPTETNPLGALESPASVIARMRNLHIPALTRELRAETGRAFNVSTENPQGTLLVRLRSETTQTHGGQVTSLHESILSRTLDEQTTTIERHQARVEQQLESTRRSLEAAEQSDSQAASELVANYLNRAAELEDRLAHLQPGQIIQTAVESASPTSTSRSLVMALAIVLGGMLAIMAAFFAQFVGAVRASLKEDATSNNPSQ